MKKEKERRALVSDESHCFQSGLEQIRPWIPLDYRGRGGGEGALGDGGDLASGEHGDDEVSGVE